MARIRTYAQDGIVTLSDKLIGSDSSGTTYNYTLTSISDIFKQANAAGIGGQFTYQLDAGEGSSVESGEMDATFSGADKDFADITAITFSIYTYEQPSTNLTNALSILSNKSILIVDCLNHNNYGIYNTGSVSIGAGATYGTLSLTYVSGNGAMVDEKVYAITVNYPDGDTTYSISCVDGDNSDEEKIRLTNSSGTTDDVVLEAGDGLSIARSSDKITFSQSSLTNANLLTALANLESSGGASDENITIGTDSGDTIVITGNLQVSGTTTTVNSTTVNLNDHNIVLDSGNSTSAVINGAGLTLEGGSGTDATFTYSTTGPQFEMKLGSDYEDLQVAKLTASELDIDGAVTVGVDDTGYDVQFFGDTAGKYMLWDTSGDTLLFPDNTKITIGTDSDTHMYHNNSNFILSNTTGSVSIWAGSSHDAGNSINCVHDGGVYLYHANNLKFTTASDGTNTTGTHDVSLGLTVGADADVTGSVKCTQNLRRTITAVTLSTNTATCTLTANDNFSFTLNNAANTINIVTAAENVGQSGTIVATNPSSVGSFSVNAIQGNGDADEVLTPDGATISWPSTANAVNLISYYVAAQDKILINFIGNFTNPT